MKRFLSLGVALGLLAACSGAAVPDAPASAARPTLSPAAQVYAIKTGYQAPLVLAVTYNARPRCTVPNAPVVCSDQATVVQLRKANDAALAALDAAEHIVRTPGVSDSALKLAIVTADSGVKALAAILSSYGAK